MIARFEDRGKVGCHNETVENQELGARSTVGLGCQLTIRIQ
jgi:hypothetical protein